MKLITAKIGGRWREVPLWATQLSFEVRPVPGFQKEAWDIWKPTLLLLEKVLSDKNWKLEWVRIHSHLGVTRSPRHSMAWVDKDTNTMLLCHFDKETMLHEIAHLPKDDAHSDAWAKRLWDLQETYLNKKEAAAGQLELTRYLSGRRLYIKKFGEKPPKYVDQVSIWVNAKPASK
jgi:hypothetical protein